MKIKTLLITIGASALISCCSLSSNLSPTRSADVSIIKTQEVLRENVDSVTTSEETTSDYLADEDNNGIPDIWEKEFEDSKLASILGGVSLSALITLILNLIYYVVRFFLDKHANTNATKLLKKTTESQNKYFDENVEIRDQLANANKETMDKLNDAIKELKETTERYNNVIEENLALKGEIQRIKSAESKILENQVLLSQTSENTKNGTAKKVKENMEIESK